MKLSDLMTQEVREIQEAIKVIDYENKGFIHVSQFGNLLRYLHLIPTNEEIAMATQKLDPQKTGRIFNSILPEAVAAFWPSTPNEISQKVWDAFQIFDVLERGVIQVEEFRNILMTVGLEPLPLHEVNKIIKQYADPVKGIINYPDIIHDWMK
ncbi:unnamed protein product [Calicophoron daubneyi]|uniref:EF-hand domain-containing protein n=1 Tax=Calicophoron daubneyi TaxID=300641 RepID=A0AAV2TQT1_CALDB